MLFVAAVRAMHEYLGRRRLQKIEQGSISSHEPRVFSQDVVVPAFVLFRRRSVVGRFFITVEIVGFVVRSDFVWVEKER